MAARAGWGVPSAQGSGHTGLLAGSRCPSHHCVSCRLPRDPRRPLTPRTGRTVPGSLRGAPAAGPSSGRAVPPAPRPPGTSRTGACRLSYVCVYRQNDFLTSVNNGEQCEAAPARRAPCSSAVLPSPARRAREFRVSSDPRPLPPDTAHAAAVCAEGSEWRPTPCPAAAAQRSSGRPRLGAQPVPAHSATRQVSLC